MEVVRKYSVATLMLIILCLAAFFVNNSALPVDSGEVKTIVTAREIIADGQWMMPTMNGELRLDKPPLAAWVASVVESIYPHDLSAQRIPAALMGVMWAMFFFGVARYMERRKGFAEIATVVFITCYNVIYFGRVVSRDIYAYAFMMAAMYFMMRLLYDSRYFAKPHKWRWALLSGLMMGLSFLSNGSVAFYSMLLPFLMVMTYYRRPDMAGRWLPLALLIVVFLATFGWWYAYLFSSNPDAIKAALANEMKTWMGGHTRPWFYYWRFFSEMGIWAVFTLAALVLPYWNSRLRTKRLYITALSWLFLALLLLSIVPEKEMTDVIVLAPSCALVVACLIFYYIERWPEDKWGKALFYFNGYLIALMVFALPFFVHIRIANRYLMDFGSELFVNLFLWGIAFYVAVSTYRQEMVGVVRGVVALFFVIECFMLGPISGIFGNSRQHSISMLQEDEVVGKLPLYYNADEPLRIELVYEAGRRILPLDLKDADAVSKAAPCLLLTKGHLSEVLPSATMERVDTAFIGKFDDNKFPRHNKHYRQELVNQVSLIQPKSPRPVIE